MSIVKILAAIAAGLELIPRAWRKAKDTFYKYRIRRLQGQLFDSKAENKYGQSVETEQRKADKEAHEKSVDEIVDYFNK